MATNIFKKLFQLAIPALFLVLAWLSPEPTIMSVTRLAAKSFWHCPIFLFTGFECPGCGMTRALIAFFSRDLELSFYFNPFGPIVGLMLVALWGWSFFKKDFSLNQILRSFPQRLVLPSLILLLTWGVARNFLDL